MGEAKRKAEARTKSQSEIGQHFLNQWNFLIRSCQGYDVGDDWELVRIAGSVATFCHDGSSRSLLTLVDFGRQFRGSYLDTAGEINGLNLLDDHPLVGVAMGSEASQYINFLDDLPQKRWLRFSKWWNGSVVRFAADGRMISRRDLILAIRNNEGYGHVGDYAHPVVEMLGDNAKIGWQAFRNGQPEAIRGNILASSVRQIGHELARSIQQHGGSLIDGGIAYAAPLGPISRQL